MSTLSQFTGGDGPVTSIVNFFSSGSASILGVNASGTNKCKETLSGALTANTLATIHTFTGRGRLNALTAYAKNTTARTIRLQVIIDGTTVFDATSDSIVTTGRGIVAVGGVGVTSGSPDGHGFQPINWGSSLVIRVASSLTETDFVATGINYEVWA